MPVPPILYSDLSIVIPAAGPGKRMKSYGPKTLIELKHGQTVVSRQVDILRHVFPGADLVVVVGYEAERVQRFLPPGVRVVENENFEDTNVARSIEMGVKASAGGAVLVVYGDLVFNRATFTGLVLGRSCVVVDSKCRRGCEVGVNIDKKTGDVEHFDYGLSPKWAHIMFAMGRELKLLRKFLFQPVSRRLFGFEVLNAMIDAGGAFAAVEPPGMRIAEIDSARDIEAARAIC